METSDISVIYMIGAGLIVVFGAKYYREITDILLVSYGVALDVIRIMERTDTNPANIATVLYQFEQYIKRDPAVIPSDVIEKMRRIIEIHDRD